MQVVCANITSSARGRSDALAAAALKVYNIIPISIRVVMQYFDITAGCSDFSLYQLVLRITAANAPAAGTGALGSFVPYGHQAIEIPNSHAGSYHYFSIFFLAELIE